MPGIRHAVNGAAALLVAFFLATGPVAATGQIICTATDVSGAAIDILVGRLPVLSVISATATDGIETWSTHAIGNQHPIVFGQGIADDSRIIVDFTDPNIERIVISLRLFQESGDKSYAEAGVLSFEGGSVFPVQCENG